MRRRLKILLPVLIGLMASLPLALAIIFAVDGDGDGDIDLTKPPQEVSVSTNGTLTTVTGGWHARQQLPSSLAPTSNATVYW